MAFDNNVAKMTETIMEREKGLKRGMKSRHLFMISLGGVIGTGLFLGSGYTVSQAGPGGAILAYLFGGLIMYLVMLCLGELAVAMPIAGSFQTYATEFISPAFGFSLGWMYWLNWAVTVGCELTAGAIFMKAWFPGVNEWVWCFVFGIFLFLLNALSAKAFGESEFWFASIKVLTIIIFIVIGFAMILGIGTGTPLGTTNYLGYGGLFPKGWSAILFTMVAVSFAFQGTELIGIAAGESEHPEQTIPKAINNTAVRTLLFYVLAIVALVGVIPWQEAGLQESPFAYVFEKAGFPAMANILTFVFLTAVLSCGNSGLYGSTRMLWSLAREGMAPAIFGKVNKHGVPMVALIATMAVAALSLLTSVFAAETVYLWLLSFSGMSGIVAWMGISASQYFFRKRLIENGGDVSQLKYRTPFYPLTPILAFVLNGVILVGMAVIPDQRIALYTGIPIFFGLYVIHKIFRPGQQLRKTIDAEVAAK